jgi:nicotinate-nucleotide adenylyltransferase
VGRAVGVLGGAFNPPHVGHMVLAQEAIWALGLDELVLVPTGQAPHKVIEPEPGPEVRLQLAAAAAQGVERVRVSGLEVEREGPSYAYRTLELLENELPGSEFTFVMGADVAASLESWRRPERVLELARVAVAGRPGVDFEAVSAALGRLGVEVGAQVLRMPEIEVSSTLVRERVAAGKPVRWLVPAAVAALICERGLYREGAGAAAPAAEEIETEGAGA